MIQLCNIYYYNFGVILEMKGIELESLKYLEKIIVVINLVFYNQECFFENRWFYFFYVKFGFG